MTTGDPPDVPAAIREAIAAVSPIDRSWSDRAAERQARLTMPPGALGRILDLGRHLAAIQKTDRPVGHRALVAVFAADHGIARAGVSAYPQEVTGQMVANFLSGGAAVNVLAARAGAEVVVIDVGVAHPVIIRDQPGRFSFQPVRAGTASFLEGPAMSREEAFRAFEVGLHVGASYSGQTGHRVIALGEMGIGNTTTAAALLAALTGAPVERVVGRGTGVDDEGLRRKRGAVELGLQLHGPEITDTWDWLARVGGLEILAMAGMAISAARYGGVVVLDGLISTVAGVIAARLCPPFRDYAIAAHLGPEPGHRIALEELGLNPLLALGLRLGEGSGAALALPLIASAADILRDMATFDSAGISGPTG